MDPNGSIYMNGRNVLWTIQMYCHRFNKSSAVNTPEFRVWHFKAEFFVHNLLRLLTSDKSIVICNWLLSIRWQVTCSYNFIDLAHYQFDGINALVLFVLLFETVNTRSVLWKRSTSHTQKFWCFKLLMPNMFRTFHA